MEIERRLNRTAEAEQQGLETLAAEYRGLAERFVQHGFYPEAIRLLGRAQVLTPGQGPWEQLLAVALVGIDEAEAREAAPMKNRPAPGEPAGTSNGS